MADLEGGPSGTNHLQLLLLSKIQLYGTIMMVYLYQLPFNYLYRVLLGYLIYPPALVINIYYKSDSEMRTLCLAKALQSSAVLLVLNFGAYPQDFLQSPRQQNYSVLERCLGLPLS